MVLAATANAAPIQVAAVNWDLLMNAAGFGQKISGDCLQISRDGSGWGELSSRSPFRYTDVWEGVGQPVTGSFDPATRRGTVTGSGGALRFDNYNVHAGAIRVGSLGLKVSGKSAVVTGRIQRARTIFSRSGPPRALLRLKGLTIQSGPFQRKGKDVPDTFVIGLYGRATVLPAFARELTRIRCRGPHIVTSHPIRAGTSFGAVKVQLRPDAATGVGGTFEIADLSATGYDAETDQDATITVTPTAPAAVAGKAIHWDLAADLRVPLQCEASYNCVPAVGAQFPLPGTVVLSWNGRSTTLANLAGSSADLNGSPGPVVTATLDGAPITVIQGDTTSELDERVGAALGLSGVRFRVGAVSAHFAKTVAP